MIKVFQCEDEGYGRIFVNDAIKKDYPNLDRDMDYFHIDANLDSLQTLVDEALTMSFSGEDKVILLTGCDFCLNLRREAVLIKMISRLS